MLDKGGSRVVLALDVIDGGKARQVAEAVAPHVAAIKVNHPLVLSQGLSIVSELAKLRPVICDFKVADIPNTNRLIVEQAVAAGAAGVIVQGFVGSDSVKQCVASAKGKDIFVVTEMSHPGGLEYTAKHWRELTEMARDAGARGVIAPATRPDRVREVRAIIGPRMLILSPGVGAQGGGAKAVLEAGADFFIVGRAIYDAADPGGAAKKYAEEGKI